MKQGNEERAGVALRDGARGDRPERTGTHAVEPPAAASELEQLPRLLHGEERELYAGQAHWSEMRRIAARHHGLRRRVNRRPNPRRPRRAARPRTTDDRLVRLKLVDIWAEVGASLEVEGAHVGGRSRRISSGSAASASAPALVGMPRSAPGISRSWLRFSGLRGQSAVAGRPTEPRQEPLGVPRQTVPRHALLITPPTHHQSRCG